MKLIEQIKKQKNDYPKTYKECINELDIHEVVATCAWEKEIKALQTLLVCRDAYWKLYGEEMGLGKPWKPNFGEDFIYAIGTCYGTVEKQMVTGGSGILLFPTEEMRDAFYENFKEEIEKCKELL